MKRKMEKKLTHNNFFRVSPTAPYFDPRRALFSHAFSVLLPRSSIMNISLRKGRSKDIDAIVETTNLAFKADAFFKKKPFHNRFTREDVAKMISTDNSIFIVAEVTLGCRDSQKTNNTTSNDSTDILTIHNSLLTKSAEVRPPAFSPLSLLCGSLYLHWELHDVTVDSLATTKTKVGCTEKT